MILKSFTAFNMLGEKGLRDFLVPAPRSVPEKVMYVMTQEWHQLLSIIVCIVVHRTPSLAYDHNSSQCLNHHLQALIHSLILTHWFSQIPSLYGPSLPTFHPHCNKDDAIPEPPQGP